MEISERKNDSAITGEREKEESGRREFPGSFLQQTNHNSERSVPQLSEARCLLLLLCKSTQSKVTGGGGEH